jgi:hypothetical protein
MILIDKTGWYRLDAVAAVTPLDVRAFHDSQGKPHPVPNIPPVVKTVAVLHLFTGAGLVTDTEFAKVLEMLQTMNTITPAPVAAAGEMTHGQ